MASMNTSSQNKYARKTSLHFMKFLYITLRSGYVVHFVCAKSQGALFFEVTYPNSYIK